MKKYIRETSVYVGDKIDDVNPIYNNTDVITVQDILNNMNPYTITDSFDNISSVLDTYMVISNKTHEDFLNELKSFLEERFNYTIIKKEGN